MSPTDAANTAMERLMIWIAGVGSVTAQVASAFEQYVITYGAFTTGLLSIAVFAYYRHQDIKLKREQMKRGEDNPAEELSDGR
ncbi:hypothetical protein ACJJIQ_05075 [Microbulbifer sp. ANSA003]|uniref:hypothetical protein n=1 Tax=unclassified Microbulbifer TaxID=2619833 RepID=UPI00403AA222